jgi:hypothetical protein
MNVLIRKTVAEETMRNLSRLLSYKESLLVFILGGVIGAWIMHQRKVRKEKKTIVIDPGDTPLSDPSAVL